MWCGGISVCGVMVILLCSMVMVILLCSVVICDKMWPQRYWDNKRGPHLQSIRQQQWRCVALRSSALEHSHSQHAILIKRRGDEGILRIVERMVQACV